MEFRGNFDGLFGGGSSQAEDTLFSQDAVEVILGISEGPIKGLVDGGKSFLVGETPLQNAQGKNNFDDFELNVYKGSDGGENIKPKLGGVATSTSVATTLATDTPVVRSGSQEQIDYLDIRLVVNQLQKITEDGTFKHIGKVKVEYKRASAGTWSPITGGASGVIDTESRTTITGLDHQNTTSTIPKNRGAFVNAFEPTAGMDPGEVWFSILEDDKPYEYDGDEWFEPAGLSSSSVNGFTKWTWFAGGTSYTAYGAGPSNSNPPNANIGDYWIQHQGLTHKAMIFNGSSWVQMSRAGNLLDSGHGSDSVGGVTVGPGGEVIFDGKVSSPFVEELRIPVPRVSEGYDIRVTKVTDPNTEELFFDVAWESFQEVIAGTFNWPNLAVAQMYGVASNQFTSIPQFSGIYEGRIVKIPTNYDPVNRVYAGVWNGLWKFGYTNNPAFIVNDLVENNRYGLNAYYPVSLNKWDVYDAGVWCDEPTGPSNKPRFTFNYLLQDPRSGKEMINFICGIFGGRFVDDGNGSARILLEKDDDPVALFAKENVVDGVFSYSYTDIASRFNDIIVSFINPNNNWTEDRRRVFSESHIERYGRIPTNFVAVGCTDAEEAIRRGTHHLLTSTTETEIIHFKTNRLGLYLAPYQIILVSDEDMEAGISGRVKAVTGDTSFLLRDPIHLENGFTYKVKFQTEDGVLERTISSSVHGTVSSIITTTDLPTLPEFATFSIEAEGSVGVPVAYRVMDITETDNPDHIEITAVQVNRTKWDSVDDAEEGEDPIVHSDVGSTQIESPTSMSIVPSVRTINGRDVEVLTVMWDRSPSKLVKSYRLYHSVNNSLKKLLIETNGTSYDFIEPDPGDHIFYVTAVALNGTESSPPAVIGHSIQGEARTIAAVTNLRLVDEPDEDTFESQNPTFEWNASRDPYFQYYLIEIIDPDGPTSVRTELVQTARFTYDYNKALTDFDGVPKRTLTISVTVIDSFGYTSNPTLLTVYNPAPAAPDPVYLDVIPSGVIVHTDRPSLSEIRDIAGLVVYAAKVPDFALDATTLRYVGPDLLTTIPIDEYGQWFFRVGYFDSWSIDGVILAGEQTVYVQQDSQTRMDNLATEVRDQIEYSQELANLADAHLRLTRNLFDTDERFTAQFQETIAAQAGVNEAFVVEIAELSASLTDLDDDLSDYATIIDSHTVQISDIDDEISAQAVTIESHTTSIGDNEASISTLVSSVNGVHVKFGVVGSINGVTGGFILEGILKNDGTVSYNVEIAGAQIQDGAISADKLAANSVTASKIAAGSVDTSELAAGAVTADKIEANAVTSDKIAANAIVAGKIAANAITAVKISAQAIETDKLKVGGVTTDRVASNAITQLLSSHSSGSISVSGETTIQSRTITRQAGSILRILAFFQLPDFTTPMGDSTILTIRLKRNGTTIHTVTSQAFMTLATGVAITHRFGGIYPIPFVDEASISGSYTYTLTLHATNDDEPPFGADVTMNPENRFLELMERLR